MAPRAPVWSAEDPDAPEDVRDALEYAREKFGGNPNVMRVMANYPEILRRYIDLSKVPYGQKSTLTPIDRELAYMTTTVLNECFY